MKRKGFTLIELLAVIIVLAILALITVPIVTNAIRKSEKSAAEISVDNYIRAVGMTVATERLGGTVIKNGEYEITSDGNICKNKTATCSDDDKIIIEVNGAKPESGKIKISLDSAQISTKLTIGDYDVTYNPKTKKYEASEKGSLITVYRITSDNISIGDTINTSDTTKYKTDPSTLGKNNYLKHVVDKNNKVIESYVCAIFNNEEVCLRGGDESFYGWSENKSDYTGNALILKELEDKGFNCDFNSKQSVCDDGSIDGITAVSTGSVMLSDSSGSCMVFDSGISRCFTS